MHQTLSFAAYRGYMRLGSSIKGLKLGYITEIIVHLAASIKAF